jgi:endoglucanase
VKLVSFCLAAALLLSAHVHAGSSARAPSNLTAVQLTQTMGVGWNLGNSLEAIGGETAWGNPATTQKLIDAVKAAGFKTIRIPVAWSQFSDAENFVIKKAWLARVDEVVHYAIKADMYVILNMHWDGGWMQPTYAEQAVVNQRMQRMWTQIAKHFQHCDERLLFAGTNEVMVDGDYGTPTEEYYTVQNSFNKTFVDTVRATRGKNATRYLVVQGFNTNINHTISFAKMPVDTVPNRLLMEVHYYDPFNFTLNDKSTVTQWGKNATDLSKVEAWAQEAHVEAQFQQMKTHYVDKGVGVILGEFGALARTHIAGHQAYRVYWNQYVAKAAVRNQMVPVYWDSGVTADGSSGLFNRNTGSQVFPDIIQALVTAAN